MIKRGLQLIENVPNYGFPIFDPFSGSLLRKVPIFTEPEIHNAISIAKSSFEKWKKTDPEVRSLILSKWGDLLHENKNELASLITAESGKPLRESTDEVLYAASYFKWFSAEATRIYGDTIPLCSAKRLLTIKQPVGVCALITPWNFPVAMAARKLGPALAAGNTCVWKPSPETPLSAYAVLNLGLLAGLPNNIVQIVSYPKEYDTVCGDYLTTHDEISKVSFTGSCKVGKRILSNGAHSVKKISLELGGNAPFIVFQDADLDKAVEGLMLSKFRNAGQTCISVNRVFLHSFIYDEFMAKVGNGADSSTLIGPLITPEACFRVSSLVNNAVKLGAEIAYQSDISHVDNLKFFPPTVLTNVSKTMKIVNEEIFGPVVSVSLFDSTEASANYTKTGLAAYFYSSDISNIFDIAEKLEVGMIGINDTGISTAVAPFGGVKESGIGREGSRHGVEDYLNIKYISIGLKS